MGWETPLPRAIRWGCCLGFCYFGFDVFMRTEGNDIPRRRHVYYDVELQIITG